MRIRLLVEWLTERRIYRADLNQTAWVRDAAKNECAYRLVNIFKQPEPVSAKISAQLGGHFATELRSERNVSEPILQRMLTLTLYCSQWRVVAR